MTLFLIFITSLPNIVVISHWWVLIDVRVTPQVTSRKKGTEELASYLRKIAAVGQTLFYASRYISLRHFTTMHWQAKPKACSPLSFLNVRHALELIYDFSYQQQQLAGYQGKIPTWMIIHPSCLTLKTAMKNKSIYQASLNFMSYFFETKQMTN